MVGTTSGFDSSNGLAGLTDCLRSAGDHIICGITTASGGEKKVCKKPSSNKRSPSWLGQVLPQALIYQMPMC